MIYLDSAATANYNENTDGLIASKMIYAMKNYWQNPSSLYQSSIEAKKQINEARNNIANFINAKSNEIIFTSGASESNNMALHGWVNSFANSKKKPHIITTRLEHKSILNLIHSKALNAEIHYCNNDENGLVDFDSLKKMLWFCNDEPVLVSIQMANNEIGSINNIESIAELTHKYNGILHVDGTQMLPYLPVNVKDLSVDMMSASGHKFSPVLKGVGFLYKKENVVVEPLIYGSQEFGFRGGTENTYSIIGLGEAVKHINFDNINEMYNKRDYLIKELEDKFGCKLNGHRACRLPNNINITFPQNITGESLLYTLDLSDMYISTGSACNSKEVVASHVLKAIGLSDDEAARTIRITISENTTYEEIDEFIEELDKAIKLIESENSHDID